MDLYCTKCGEPWELDSLHDLVEEGRAESFTRARVLFQNQGCEAFGCTHNSERDSEVALASSLMFDMLGDDVDGIAAMMEDFGLY